MEDIGRVMQQERWVGKGSSAARFSSPNPGRKFMRGSARKKQEDRPERQSWFAVPQRGRYRAHLSPRNGPGKKKKKGIRQIIKTSGLSYSPGRENKAGLLVAAGHRQKRKLSYFRTSFRS